MYAPHASQAHTRPATRTRSAALGWSAATLPAVPIPADGPAFVDAPTLGVVAAAVPVTAEVAVLAAAVALPTLYVGGQLLRARSRGRSVPARPRGRSVPARSRGQSVLARPWSGTGGRAWYGLGLCVVGLAAVAIAVSGSLGAPAYVLAIWVNLAAVSAGTAFLPALLAMSSPAISIRVRLRRALDGAIVGLCLMFCGRVLVVSPHPNLDSPAFWLIMFHCCVLATAVLAAVRPRHGGRGPVLCAAGVGAATVGLSGLAYALAHEAPMAVTGAIVALLLAAPVLIQRGVGATVGTLPAMVPHAPLVAAPIVLALAVALYQLATGGYVDRGAMMLGTLAAVAVGARRLGATLGGEAGAEESSGPPGPGGDRAGGNPADRAMDGVGGDRIGRGRDGGLSAAIDGMRSARTPPGALLVIGIDGSAADVARDEVQREVARRLREVAPPEHGDRVGGTYPRVHLTATEVAVLTDVNLAQAYGLAERLVAGLARPLVVGQETIHMSACAGLTDVVGASGPEDAINRARVALQRARQLGPGRVEWYDVAVAEAVARRATMERDLPDAAHRGELDLIYQPIMDLERGRPLAVEALLRWRHPRLGTLLPADVIPVAEATGAIAEVGHWVLWRAIAQLASWRAAGRDLSMAVNVSPCQLRSVDLVSEVAAVLAAYHLPPERLVVEIAESGIGDGAGVDECVGELHSIGVQTALDEFGTGVASLAHLRTLPIDMVKIGQPLAGAEASLPLIGVMVGVGRRLGIEVVAQGVEAPGQLAAVRDAGCRLGQGHFFARPRPAEHTEAYLDGFATR